MEQIVSVSGVPVRSNSNLVRPVESAFRILDLLSQSQEGKHVSELARTLDLPKATVFRILFTLNHLGYARKDSSTHTYHSCREIAWFPRDEGYETLRRVARPHMERLLTRFEQTVNLAVLDRGQALYIEILEGLRSIRMSANVNTYTPVHSTAVGKSMLAFLHPVEAEEILQRSSLSKLTARSITSVRTLLKALSKIRDEGFAVDNEETEKGARCVGAPIFDLRGRPIGAISISGPISAVTQKATRQIALSLVAACSKISSQFGFTALSKQSSRA